MGTSRNAFGATTHQQSNTDITKSSMVFLFLFVLRVETNLGSEESYEQLQTGLKDLLSQFDRIPYKELSDRLGMSGKEIARLVRKVGQKVKPGVSDVNIPDYDSEDPSDEVVEVNKQGKQTVSPVKSKTTLETIEKDSVESVAKSEEKLKKLKESNEDVEELNYEENNDAENHDEETKSKYQQHNIEKESKNKKSFLKKMSKKINIKSDNNNKRNEESEEEDDNDDYEFGKKISGFKNEGSNSHKNHIQKHNKYSVESDENLSQLSQEVDKHNFETAQLVPNKSLLEGSHRCSVAKEQDAVGKNKTVTEKTVVSASGKLKSNSASIVERNVVKPLTQEEVENKPSKYEKISKTVHLKRAKSKSKTNLKSTNIDSQPLEKKRNPLIYETDASNKNKRETENLFKRMRNNENLQLFNWNFKSKQNLPTAEDKDIHETKENTKLEINQNSPEMVNFRNNIKEFKQPHVNSNNNEPLRIGNPVIRSAIKSSQILRSNQRLKYPGRYSNILQPLDRYIFLKNRQSPYWSARDGDISTDGGRKRNPMLPKFEYPPVKITRYFKDGAGNKAVTEFFIQLPQEILNAVRLSRGIRRRRKVLR